MKYKYFFYIYLCLSIFASFAIAQDSTFHNKLNRYSLSFKMPTGFKKVPVKENRDVVYDYAVRNETGTFEIRYRVLPIDTSTAVLNETRVNPNRIFSSMLVAMMLNISGGKMGNHGFFDSSAVKEEFNANSGATGFVEVNSAFGEGYSFCMINVIHRDDIADAYIFYLFNDKSEVVKTLNREDVFHAFKFK